MTSPLSQSPTTFDVIVIGGGAIGMTSAWRLAQTGRRVLLLEKGLLGQEASSAAAGMLGAQLECREPGPFYQLCLESRALYRSFVEELEDYTGIDAQLVQGGIYQLAFTEAQTVELEIQRAWQTSHGGTAEWLSGEQVAKEETSLAPCLGALWLSEDQNVNAPLLVRALAVAVNQSCVVHEGADVTGIAMHQSGGFTVRTSTSDFTAHDVVVAAGAWAERLLRPFGLSPAIRPVKGQMLAIQPRHGQRLHHTVFSQHAYLVPKRDGSVVVGATEDWNAGFNREVTADGLKWLLDSVHRIAPGIADGAFTRTWTGLRPGSDRQGPWIGGLPGYAGLHLAIGHFRNGILLSPVTGQMVVRLVEGRPWPIRWNEFRSSATAESEPFGNIQTEIILKEEKVK